MTVQRKWYRKRTFSALWVHLIWSTEYREPLIVPSLKWKLYEYIRKVSSDRKYCLDFINGPADHVHLLYALKPHQTISTLVKDVKGNTWQWVREHGLSERYFSWQDGYVAVSVSPSRVQAVRRYIYREEQRHRRESLKVELDRLKNAVIVPPFLDWER